MVAATFDDARVAAGESTAPGQSFFARVLKAMIEARTQQARREIRMHTQLLRESQTEELPFGGW
ncbi:MAG TPA: hypothetical protein VGJ01_11210 [Pseudolabrys sp.]|jgi:hypothetical protein